MIKRGDWGISILAMAFMALLLALPLTAGAADVYWTGNDGDGLWSTGGNWDVGVPGSGDTAYLSNGGTVTYDADNPSLFSLDISASDDLSSTVLEHTSGTLTLEDGGGLTVNATGYGGYAAYNLSGTGVLSKENFEVKIGTDGTGHFEQSGGTFQLGGALYLGDQSTGHGIYNMIGGDIVAGPNGAGDIVLGEWGGTGEFNQSGGTVHINNLTLARQDGSTGYYVLSGDPSSSVTLVTANTFVGNRGTGIFTQSGGIHRVGVDDDGTVQDGSHELIVGRFAGSNGTYNLTGGELYVKREIVGDAGDGKTASIGLFNQSNASVHVISEDLIIGQDAKSSGTFTLAGTAQLTVGGNVYLGDEGGIGLFEQTGGAAEFQQDLVIGTNSEGGSGLSLGTYNLTDGDLIVTGQMIVGHGNQSYSSGLNGLFTQSDGTVNAGQIIIGGFYDGNGSYYGTGRYELSGGTVTAQYTSVGNAGQGRVLQTGGEFNAGVLELGSAGLFAVDDGAGGFNFYSSGIYDLQGGTLNTKGTTVAQFGLGTFNQNDLHGTSQHTVSGNLVVGAGPGLIAKGSDQIREGIYNLSGNVSSSVLKVSGDTIIGAGNNTFAGEPGGKGTFNQSGGSHTVTGNLIIGQGSYSDASAGGTGIYNLSGGSLQVDLSTIVGGSGDSGPGGTGTFTQTGGTHTIDDNLILGQQAESSGTYNLSGDTSSSLSARETHVGTEGTGAFIQEGGVHTTGTLVLGYNTGGTGTYELKSGSLSSDFQRIGLDGQGTFIQTGGKNTVTDTLVIGQEPGSQGTYNLSGGSLTADKIINNGTFIYNDIATLNFSVFSGSGTFEGNLTNNATVAPGNSPGTMNITGNYAQGTAGTLAIELGSSAYDVLNITGTADLAGILNVSLYDGYTPTDGSVFDFLTAAGGISGGFSSIVGPSGWSWNVAYLDLVGNDGKFDTARLSANAVPIPPSIWLLAFGLFGLAGIRRKIRD